MFFVVAAEVRWILVADFETGACGVEVAGELPAGFNNLEKNRTISRSPTLSSDGQTLAGFCPIINEPAREVYQVVAPVVSLLLKEALPVRELIPNRLIVNQHSGCAFASDFAHT